MGTTIKYGRKIRAATGSHTITGKTAALRTPQGSNRPALLDGYAHPPARVTPGVDNFKGPNASAIAAMKDPATDTLPTGVSYDTANHLIRISGDDVTFDGWQSNGFTLYVTGKRPVITNNYLYTTALGRSPIQIRAESNDGGTITGNLFDGKGFSTTDAGQLWIMGFGLFVIEDNYFRQAWNDCIHQSSGAGTLTLRMRRNLMENCGLGALDDHGLGEHGDWVQLDTAATVTPVFEDNLCVMKRELMDAGLNSLFDHASAQPQFWETGTFTNGTYKNNTFLYPPDPEHPTRATGNYGGNIDLSSLTTNLDVNGNYYDRRALIDGGATIWTQIANLGFGPGPAAHATFTGNFDIITGASL